MPELPEVETVARQVDAAIKGRTLREVRIHDAKLRANYSQMSKYRVKRCYRRGKEVLIELGFNRQRLFLAVHLRMTGRLIWYPTNSSRAVSADFFYRDSALKPPRAELLFNGGRLAFHDTRRFGTFKIVKKEAELSAIGVEPLSNKFTVSLLADLLESSKQPLKNWLLRQDRIVGIGNIYASEILHAAKLSPTREAGSLNLKETKLLYRKTRSILEKAIENCGTTFSDFQQTDGEIGSYQNYLKVYEREGERCSRCRSTILREVQAGRSSYFCPDCQL